MAEERFQFLILKFKRHLQNNSFSNSSYIFSLSVLGKIKGIIHRKIKFSENPRFRWDFYWTTLQKEDSYFSWNLHLHDEFISNTQLFTSQGVNWWIGVVWIIYHLFGLSFWRHLFTAEDPFHDGIIISPNLFWWRNNLIYIVHFHFWVQYSVLPDWKCPSIVPEAQNYCIWKKIIVHESNVQNKDCSILQVCTTQHQKDQALSNGACCTTSCPGPCHF